MLTIPDDVATREPWLRGYLLDSDRNLDDVRRRAAAAARGEVIRRRHDRGPTLRLRHVDGGTATTSAAPIAVVLTSDGTVKLDDVPADTTPHP